MLSLDYLQVNRNGSRDFCNRLFPTWQAVLHEISASSAAVFAQRGQSVCPLRYLASNYVVTEYAEKPSGLLSQQRTAQVYTQRQIMSSYLPFLPPTLRSKKHQENSPWNPSPYALTNTQLSRPFLRPAGRECVGCSFVCRQGPERQ